MRREKRNPLLKLLLACLAGAAALPPTDAYGQEIVQLARWRHGNADATLRDYRSRMKTLVSLGFINDPLAPPQLVLASELATHVAWQRAGGLQLKMLGQRYVTSFGPDTEAGLDFDEPWFVATTPGDSLRLLGGIEIPGRAAVHPFAEGAERYYEYAIGDTVRLLTPARDVDLVEISVTPTRGDEALVVGSIWVDATSGDVGAMQIRFVGKPLWADEDDPDGSAWTNRILSVSATLQQGLWERRYWLPRRQELELMIRVPFIGNLAFPIVFRSEFGRYEINSGQPISWLSPDSLRTPTDARAAYAGATLSIGQGGRSEPVAVGDSSRYDRAFPNRDALQVRAGWAENGWEIIRPPDDSLLGYGEWDHPLDAPASRLTLPSAEDLERRTRQLSNEVVGRKVFAIQYDRLPEMIRYNRVEALGIGLAARWDVPRRAFWSLGGAVGFGFGDLEPKARLDVRYDAPGSRAEFAAYSELHLAGAALTDDKRAYGNAFRAFFLGRDDADYYRASGLALTLGKRWGWITGRLGLGWEDHSSVDKKTDIAVTGIWEDSVFQPNAGAVESGFWRAGLAMTGYIGDWTRPTNRAQLTLALEAGSDADAVDYLQPRAVLESRADFGSIAALAVNARGGWTAGVAPLQRAWRIGGIRSVRGFTHGTLSGDSHWAAQIELSPRRRSLTPIVFADVGWAGPTEEWPSDNGVLWSLGAGASFLYGIFRVDLLFPKLDDVWLELYFGGSL